MVEADVADGAKCEPARRRIVDAELVAVEQRNRRLESARLKAIQWIVCLAIACREESACAARVLDLAADAGLVLLDRENAIELAGVRAQLIRRDSVKVEVDVVEDELR